MDEVIKFNILKNTYKKPNIANKNKLNNKENEKKKENEEIQLNLYVNKFEKEKINTIKYNEIFIKGNKSKEESLIRLIEEKEKEIEKLKEKLRNKKFEELTINNKINEINAVKFNIFRNTRVCLCSSFSI